VINTTFIVFLLLVLLLNYYTQNVLSCMVSVNFLSFFLSFDLVQLCFRKKCRSLMVCDFAYTY
jgi:hypothetical protein